MGKRFIGFAMFAKYVFDRVQAQGLESETSKESFLSNKLLATLESENKNAFDDIVAAIKCFSLASFLLLIMVAVK